jgi:hypothetical protein
VIRDAAPDDATTDNDDPILALHAKTTFEREIKCSGVYPAKVPTSRPRVASQGERLR